MKNNEKNATNNKLVLRFTGGPTFAPGEREAF